MKSPTDALADLDRRLAKVWSAVVTGAAWDTDIRLSSSGLTGKRLAQEWDVVQPLQSQWRVWAAAAGEGVEVRWRTATVHRSEQPLPSVLRVVDIHTAARLLQAGWPERLAQARARAVRLTAAFPDHPDHAGVLRATRELTDVDFDLVVRSARWFADPHEPGLTARQVPVVGMGTKWLNRRESVVRRLARLESLDLLSGRPSRIHLTYLDPVLRGDARRYDVATVGDVDAVLYRPSVVLISENRDTAQQFPDVVGGIAIEGDGNGPGGIPDLAWVRDCPDLVYWGDMDAKGLEILASYRARGLPVRSLFMDMRSYERWERFGVDHDHSEAPIAVRPPKEGLALEPAELELYLALCSPEWSRHRRIEQERIPLEDAAAVLRAG